MLLFASHFLASRCKSFMNHISHRFVSSCYVPSGFVSSGLALPRHVESRLISRHLCGLVLSDVACLLTRLFA